MKSSLVTKSIANPNWQKYANRNGCKVEYVVPHHAAGMSSALAIAKYEIGAGVSTHYVVDETDYVSCVDEMHGSYANGNADANRKSVTFEMRNSAGAAGGWAISPEVFERAAKLTADILTRYGLGAAVYGKTVRLHRDFVATACPGTFFAHRIQEFCDRVNAIMGGAAAPAPMPTQKPATPTQNPSAPVRTLRQGMQGDDVRAVQKLVGVTADGIYGPKTVAAVKVWQRKNGLVVDGIFGAASRKAAGL